MSGLPDLTWVDSPAALPHKLPAGRFSVVDVAFASGEKFQQTQRFIKEHGGDLAAWVDHHKHDGWVDYLSDPRFVLVPNVKAHACPELVTPEVVRRVGPVTRILAHSDFDGLMSAVNWLRGGEPPYPEANEDARAADSPGRGHHMSARGQRLQDALEEHKERAHTPERHALLTRVVLALVDGAESSELTAQLDELAKNAVKVTQQAQALLMRGREEFPGLFVVRHPSNLAKVRDSPPVVPPNPSSGDDCISAIEGNASRCCVFFADPRGPATREAPLPSGPLPSIPFDLAGTAIFLDPGTVAAVSTGAGGFLSSSSCSIVRNSLSFSANLTSCADLIFLQPTPVLCESALLLPSIFLLSPIPSLSLLPRP